MPTFINEGDDLFKESKGLSHYVGGINGNYKDQLGRPCTKIEEHINAKRQQWKKLKKKVRILSLFHIAGRLKRHQFKLH